jgi:hypothetical protein
MIILTLTAAGREKAEKVSAIESRFYEAIADLVKDAPLPEMLGLLRRFVEGKPAGMALARRIEKETRSDTLSL